VSVAKIGKGAVNGNEKPQLQRKKSKTTDDIVENKPTVEEIETANLAATGENDSENSPTPRRKRSLSDMSNVVVSNAKQKELEETNEEHEKKDQMQRQQSKNFLKSFYKSLKHSFSNTSKRNLVGSKEVQHHQNNNNTNHENAKDTKKSEENEEKVHKKDKKDKKMNKQSSLSNVKDKDKIKSKQPSKSASNVSNNKK